MRLQARLVLLFGLLVAVATAASGIFSYAATRDEAVASVDQFLENRNARGPGRDLDTARPVLAELTRLRELQETAGLDASNAETVRRFVGDASVFTMIGRDSQVVFTSDPTITLPAPEDGATGTALTSIDVDGVRYRLRTQVFDDGVTVLTARSLAETDATLAAVRNRLIVVALLITSLAVMVSWFVASRIARPLQRLSEAAEHITQTGELATPLDVGASGEVGQVASSFTRMLNTVARSRAQQQQLVVDAGHELRTPLTTLRSNIELVATGRLTAEDQGRALQLALSEVEELSHLTAELVELAGDQPVDAELSAVDMCDIAHAAAARSQARSGRAVTVRGNSAPLIGNAAGLDRAVSNLLGNATKFSTEGTEITVEVTPTSVTVLNSGPPVPTEVLERVFERFYRAPASRSLPGSGLGLAIVAAVADAHSGEPFARSTATGIAVGFTFAAGNSTSS